MSVAPVAVRRRAASLIEIRSSCFVGSLNSGKPPSAWRARNQASAGSVRLSVSASASGAAPFGPTWSARARSIECSRRMRRSLLLRGDALWPAHDREQHAAVEQALGHALGIVERDRVDQGRPAIDVVDAEIVELHAHELVRNLGRGIKAKRERAFEVGLGL